jgi:hypothetical protein
VAAGDTGDQRRRNGGHNAVGEHIASAAKTENAAGHLAGRSPVDAEG